MSMPQTFREYINEMFKTLTSLGKNTVRRLERLELANATIKDRLKRLEKAQREV